MGLFRISRMRCAAARSQAEEIVQKSSYVMGQQVRKLDEQCRPHHLAQSVQLLPSGKQASRTGRLNAEQQQTVSTIVAALRRCSKMRDLQGGKKLHQDSVEAGLHTNAYVGSSLITMYSRCGSMQLARQVFDRMVHRDVVSWNALMLGYVQNGESLVALDLLTSMDCAPSSVTYVAALKACTGLVSEKEAAKREVGLQKGITLDKELTARGFSSDRVVANCLVDMYSKCGNMHRAKEFFDRMNSKDVVTWTSLILGYVQNEESLAAMDLFSSMDCEPDLYTYAAVLKACGGLASEKQSERHFYLEKGISIHKQMKDRGCGTDMVASSSLVDMYSKCGSMHRAREVFDMMKRKDVVTWNSLILGYEQNRQSLVAMDLFTAMDCEPNAVTYVALLKACASLGSMSDSDKHFSLRKGIWIHREVKERGFESNIVVASSLVDMYSKSGSIDQTREVFDKMDAKTAVTWTSLLLGYVQNGQSSVSMELFTSMDCEPDPLTYVAVLKACGSSASEKQNSKLQSSSINDDLQRGMRVHKQVNDLGFDADILVANSLVDMYSKCGSMNLAKEVFQNTLFKNVVTWNTIILGYVQNGESLLALDLFSRMDCAPDCYTYVAVLKACGSLPALSVGLDIHAVVCKLGLEQDPLIVNTLMDLYVKCGSMARVEELFNNMNFRDTVSWNILITGFSSLGDSSQVFNLAKRMQEEGLEMNGITFTCILTACSHRGLVEQGKRCFNSIRERGVSLSVEHYNCMVDMLARKNRLQDALKFIKNMGCEANSVTWMTLLGACRKWKNAEIGKVAFDDIMIVGGGEKRAGAYVLMSDIYRSLSMWEDLEQLVIEQKEQNR